MIWREWAREWARAGVVASAAGVAALRRPVRSASDTSAPRILLVRPDHLGDVLLTTPAIAALRAALPAAHLIALVGPWSADVLAHNPHLDEIHVIRFPGMTRTSAPAPWAPYVQLAREGRRIARWQVDAAINVRPDYWWGAALLALASIPIRVGYDRAPSTHALTHRLAWPAAPEHTARTALRLAATTAAALGTPDAISLPWTPQTYPLVYRLDDAARDWARDWLARAGLPADARPLLIHPGAGAAVKLWTPDAWARVCDHLAARTGAPLIVAGTRAEADLVAAVAQAVRSPAVVASFADDVPLVRYAALLESARLVLGVDSGALHLAAAVGTPTVRLFGPTDPAIFGPWGPSARHAVVRGAELPCMPCGRLDYRPGELPAHPCVRLIHPNMVVEAALEVLARTEQTDQDEERRFHVSAESTPDAGAITPVGSSSI